MGWPPVTHKFSVLTLRWEKVSGEPLCSMATVGYYGALLTLFAAGQTGRWNTENCRKVTDGGGRTTCRCQQLGHFGLLFVSAMKFAAAYTW